MMRKYRLLLILIVCAITSNLAQATQLSPHLDEMKFKYFTLSVPENMEMSTSPLNPTRIIGNRAYPTDGGLTYKFKFVKNIKNSAEFHASYTPPLPFFFKTFQKPRKILRNMALQIRNDMHAMEKLDKHYTATSVEEKRFKLNLVEYHSIIIKYSSSRGTQKAILAFFFTTHDQRIFEFEMISRGENYHAALENFRILAQMMHSVKYE